MYLKKNNKDLNDLMIKGAISIDELKYILIEDALNECFDQKYIIKGSQLIVTKYLLE